MTKMMLTTSMDIKTEKIKKDSTGHCDCDNERKEDKRPRVSDHKNIYELSLLAIA